MKLNHHGDTDSLYIDLSEQVSAESREVTERVALDRSHTCHESCIFGDRERPATRAEGCAVGPLPY